MDRGSRASNQAAVPLHFLEMFQPQRRKHELRPIFHHSHLDFLRKSRSRIEGFELIPTDFTSDKKPTPPPSFPSHLLLSSSFSPQIHISKIGIKGYFGHYLPVQYVSQLTRDNPRLGYDQFSLCLSQRPLLPLLLLLDPLISKLTIPFIFFIFFIFPRQNCMEQGVPIKYYNVCS